MRRASTIELGDASLRALERDLRRKGDVERPLETDRSESLAAGDERRALEDEDFVERPRSVSSLLSFTKPRVSIDVKDSLVKPEVGRPVSVLGEASGLFGRRSWAAWGALEVRCRAYEIGGVWSGWLEVSEYVLETRLGGEEADETEDSGLGSDTSELIDWEDWLRLKDWEEARGVEWPDCGAL